MFFDPPCMLKRGQAGYLTTLLPRQRDVSTLATPLRWSCCYSSRLAILQYQPCTAVFTAFLIPTNRRVSEHSGYTAITARVPHEAVPQIAFVKSAGVSPSCMILLLVCVSDAPPSLHSTDLQEGALRLHVLLAALTAPFPFGLLLMSSHATLRES